MLERGQRFYGDAIEDIQLMKSQLPLVRSFMADMVVMRAKLDFILRRKEATEEVSDASDEGDSDACDKGDNDAYDEGNNGTRGGSGRQRALTWPGR